MHAILHCLSFKFPRNPSFSHLIHSSVVLKCSQRPDDGWLTLLTRWKTTLLTLRKPDLDSQQSPPSSKEIKYGSYEETFNKPMSVTVRDWKRKKRARGISIDDKDNSGNDLSSSDEIWGSMVCGEIAGEKKRDLDDRVCAEKQNFVGKIESINDGGRLGGSEVSNNKVRTWLDWNSGDDAGPVRLADLNVAINQEDRRIPLPGLFGAEVERVIGGGGVVPGSLILLCGDPGVGKSTFLLQISAIIANGNHQAGPSPIVYVSGEESIEQIGNRIHRMNIQTPHLSLYSGTEVDNMLKKIQCLSPQPQALVIDSIQTVYMKGVAKSAGSVTQIRACATAFLRFAKKTNIPILLAGHVTKNGGIAGPRALEHIVDIVLYIEGDELSSHRLLRSLKNRFGSTNEIGVFEMSRSGLQPVLNPSEIFLRGAYSDSEFRAGSAISVVMGGSRAFLVEVQALCITKGSTTKQVNGVLLNKADMMIAALNKHAELNLKLKGVFVNVANGARLFDTAGDLALAAAICSSVFERPIPKGVAFIGEVGLDGDLRMVPKMEKRVLTLSSLGCKKCIVPKLAIQHLSNPDLELVGCRNLKDMINAVFK